MLIRMLSLIPHVLMQNAAETLKHDEAPSKVDQKHVTTFCNAGAHLMFLPRPPKHPESATG